MAQDKDKRIALVTGASRGIGRAAAICLARRGAHVVALARTTGALEELDDEIKAAGGTSTLVPLDVRDFDGLDRLGASIAERWGKLDVLICNAGMLGGLSPLQHTKPKTFEDTLAVNLTANFRLARSMEALLKQSDAGRVVFVTSGAARSLKPYWGSYAVSKAALEALALTWAGELAKSAVKINLFNPGPTATRMRRQAMPGEDQSKLPGPAAVAEAMMVLCEPDLATSGAIFSYKDGGLGAPEAG